MATTQKTIRNTRLLVLGIDVGSVSLSCVLMDSAKQLVAQYSVFHKGDPRHHLRQILRQLGKDIDGVHRIVVTDSTPEIIAADARQNNLLATIRAAKEEFPKLRGILQVGGEKFSLSRFSEDGTYLGSTTNTSCAAGTGSFLDQQSGRLQLESSAELDRIASGCNGDSPKIASRCAVFAKTDLIHAQQEGYSLEQISNGLCRGLAKNIVDTLFTTPESTIGPIVFCGGVAKNRTVVKQIEDLTNTRLTVAERGHLYGAIGCCLIELDALGESACHDLPVRSLDPEILLGSDRAALPAKRYSYPPLELKLSDYPDFAGLKSYTTRPLANVPAVEVDIYLDLEKVEGVFPVSLGIDIGSTSTKAVLLNQKREVVAGFYTRTAGRPIEAVQQIFGAIHEIESDHGVQFSVRNCATTGSGRKLLGAVIGADAVIDEITAHARAAVELNPDVDTIIEIGGQDAKFTTLEKGRVTSATMNNVCAAGTGSFIEEQAAKLGCSLDEYSRRAERVHAPMTSDRCTVFMERDINHFLTDGYSVDEVLASALHSVRENYLMKVANLANIGKVVFFQGATAKNRALVAAFEQRLNRPILVSKYCHLTGALGCALLAREEHKGASGFRGFSIWKEQIPVTGEVCSLCNNHCKLTICEIEGEKVAYGFLCGRDYDSKQYVAREDQLKDLLQRRKKLARKITGKVVTDTTVPTVGIPAAVHLVQDLVLWKKFFSLLGVRTITSEGLEDPVGQGKHLCQAEFCAPCTSFHGHVHHLQKRADYVFLPIYLEEKTEQGATSRRQYCYYTQFLPALTANSEGIEERRLLRPLIRYLFTGFHTKVQLFRMMQRLDPHRWNFFEVAAAFDEARNSFLRYQQQLKDEFSTRLQNLAEDDIAVVFLGRPYTLLSRSLNCNIPTIFARLGIETGFQDMIDLSEPEDTAVQPILDQLHWHHAANIMRTAQRIAELDGVYPVYVTSFKCSPDSFGVQYFKKLMNDYDKPYLILELDEHGSSVGYETRVEAAVRAFRNHRKTGEKKQPSPELFLPRYTSSLTEKELFFPNWDRITCSFLVASLRREGIRAHLLEETEDSIRESLHHNTGQCIPLNNVAQAFINTVRNREMKPENCVLWLNKSTLACNIGLYPYHIQHLLRQQSDSMGKASIYIGELSLADISIRAAKNAYFAYMFGGMLRKVACRIRPYEKIPGTTDRVLDRGIAILADAFAGHRPLEKSLEDVIARFEWIDRVDEQRPKVGIFGDLYSRDNRVMNQDLIRFIEQHGGEAVTTPYSEYARMIASSYFRKWFNEGKYFNVLANRALLAAMTALEGSYRNIFNRILKEPEHSYTDSPQSILERFNICRENTGESMDNILKIHYLTKHHPDLALLVQASPALCCASLVTEGMKRKIEQVTSVPVVSITYDGTGGSKNDVLIPYLRYRKTPSKSFSGDGSCLRVGAT